MSRSSKTIQEDLSKIDDLIGELERSLPGSHRKYWFEKAVGLLRFTFVCVCPPLSVVLGVGTAIFGSGDGVDKGGAILVLPFLTFGALSFFLVIAWGALVIPALWARQRVTELRELSRIKESKPADDQLLKLLLERPENDPVVLGCLSAPGFVSPKVRDDFQAEWERRRSNRESIRSQLNAASSRRKVLEKELQQARCDHVWGEYVASGFGSRYQYFNFKCRICECSVTLSRGGVVDWARSQKSIGPGEVKRLEYLARD